MTTPIYTLPLVPGALEMTAWATFCHSKTPFIVIRHDNVRYTSRWVCVERKRPFQVVFYSRGRFGLSGTEYWFQTLEKAQAYAAKLGEE